MRRTWLIIGCVAALAATWLSGGSAVAHAAGPARPTAGPRIVTITIPDRHGEIPARWLPYSGPPRADVLLPAGFDPGKRYPLALNLGGLGGDYAQASLGTWVHLNAIVVTPEAFDGWYADWWNNGKRADPAWESYYLDEVIPQVLAKYRILPGRRYHAIFGISMGGLGAAYLGGRLPGFFGTVASLSGFVDPQLYSSVTQSAMGDVSLAPYRGDDDTYPVYGPPKGFYADGHNPTQLAMNLRHTRVFETEGNGVPSSAEMTNPGYVPAGSGAEGLLIRPMNERYHRALVAAGVNVTYVVHAGGHDQPDFKQEIAAMLAWGLFKPVLAHPKSWTDKTVATSGQLWDIGYRFAAPPTEIVRFHRSGSSLSISAAGSSVSVTTSAGCTITTGTPATIRVPHGKC